MKVTFRPLPTWPHEPTNPRIYDRFDSTYQQTLQQLEHEIGKLDGSNVIVGAGFRESDLRLDGLPRADRRQDPYMHPGIEVSFDSRYGRLTYATDRFDDWKANLRAIALGLKAQRDMDRWGFARRGQQYAGFMAIGAGGPDAERGRKLVEKHGGIRPALMATHPDHGGDPRAFADVQAFRERVGDA